MIRLFCLLLPVLFLAGCAGMPGKPERGEVLAAAEKAGFKQALHDGGTFLLPAWSRGSFSSGTVHVYIEGDGRAWTSRYRPSDDPTPRHPVALRLALLDPHSDVLYLGRPCQYGARIKDPSCDRRFWTEERFSPAVIAAYETVLKDQVFSRGNAVDLIGYSGGGAVALLLAARKPGAYRSVTTLAGILDHAAWTQYHRVTPLTGSLNPADFRDSLRSISQRHIVGADDRIAPASLADSFATQMQDPKSVTIIHVPGATHDAGWFSLWPSLIAAQT